MKNDENLLFKNYKQYCSHDLTKMLLEYMAKEKDNEIQNQLMLDLVSKYVEVSKRLEVKIKEVELVSITDPLTKVYNRLKFNKEFIQELERYKRYNSEFAIIMLDIDHFKTVNDTYGHDIGDTTLITLTEVIGKIIRKNDIFARWGGEEFIILDVESNLTEALNLAERIRKAVENTEFEKVKKVTCSFGVTMVRSSDTIITATKRADNALYTAKQNGRNRVESQ